MKRVYCLLFALSLVAAVSCSVEENKHQPAGYTVVNAETGGARAMLGQKADGKYPVLWQPGDRIDINGNVSEPLDAGFMPAGSARFLFSGNLGSSYHALSPASAMVSYSDGAANITLPTEQAYVEGSFDPAAALMFAIGAPGNGIHFSTPLAFMRLTINAGSNASQDIVRVTLSANGGEKMSGSFTTDYSALTDTPSGEDSVSLSIPAGLTLGKDVIIAYPARKYVQGMSLEIEDAQGTKVRKVSDSEHNPNAGRIYKTTVTFEPGSGNSGFTIAALENEDLDVEWQAAPATGPKDGHTWQILFIGNSLTLDATHFLPQLLNAAGVTNVELTRTFHGGQTIKGYNDNYNNSAHNSIATWKPGQSRWQGEEEYTNSVKDAVRLHQYDIVCIQDYPGNSVFWQWDNTESSAVIGLVMKIKSDQDNPAPEFVFHLPHSHADSYEATTGTYFNHSSRLMFETVAETTRHLLAETPFTRVISTGAMIQSLRTSVVNQGNDRDMLRGDGVHMDYGFTRYGAGLLIFKTLFTPVTGVDIADINWRFEEYCPYRTTYCTPVTDGNIGLLRAAVQAAYDKPLEVTDLSSVSAPANYSLNPARAMELDDNSSIPESVEWPVVFKLGNSENTATTIPYWNGYCIWQCRTQPQAYAKWVMTSLPRTDVIQCHTFANNTDSNISSPSFRGIWTGDYFEFVLPVRNIAAGTKVKFSAPFYERQSPVFWDFEWYDEGVWKSEKSVKTSYDGAFSKECSFAIGYETTRVEQTATFSGAIAEGYLRFRVKCADGRVQGSSASAAADREEPYYTSGNEYNSVFYFYDAADANQAVRFDLIP